MQTIIILLDPKKTENADLDLTYALPVRIEGYTDNKVYDNGYDYLENNILGVWLETENAAENVGRVIELIKNERIVGNDLSKSAEIYVSEKECAALGDCKQVYP